MSLLARLALLAAFACAAAPAFAADHRVHRIDSLVATRKKGAILVEAKGAVETGGWKNARLHVLHSDAHGVIVEFVASPPPPGMTVIEALVPVAATATIRARGPVPSVRVLADANEMTAQILK